MGASLGVFLGTWTLMMAAMMLPSAVPMIRLHHLRLNELSLSHRIGRTTVFVAPYLLTWALVGVPLWVAMPLRGSLPARQQLLLIAGVLLLAGIYQLSPLKRACLRVCRSPMDFLLTHWYRGVGGELRLGFEHAFYCLGCCWALMAVFVTAGAMGLLWAAVIGVVVFIEKVAPHGVGFSRGVAALLILGAIAVAVRPEMIPTIAMGM